MYQKMNRNNFMIKKLLIIIKYFIIKKIKKFYTIRYLAVAVHHSNRNIK